MKHLKEEVADIFGFAELEKRNEPKPRAEDELPIQPFYMNKMLESLAHEKVGGLQVSHPFPDQLQWGNTDGAIRIRLTPNQGVCLERLTADLHGRPLWITKELVRVKTHEFVDHEDIVAREIGQHVKLIAREQIDSPQREYKQLFALTRRIAQTVNGTNKLFVFDEIKKINDNNYNIQMSLLGSGVGKIVATGARQSKLTPVGIIDMSYDPEKGSIKSIISTVDIENEGSPWHIDIPYFVGQFSPSQPMEEIVRAVIAGLKFV